MSAQPFCVGCGAQGGARRVKGLDALPGVLARGRREGVRIDEHAEKLAYSSARVWHMRGGTTLEGCYTGQPQAVAEWALSASLRR